MATHTARLIFTVIFFMCALSGLLSGFWLGALFWALVAMAVGYPFVRGGALDLNYEDGSTQFVFLPAPAPGAAPMYEALAQGAV